MNEPFLIRPRRGRRHGARRPLRLAPATAVPGGAAFALPADAPRLLMAEPESSRETWISGSLTLAVHAAALGILLLVGVLAPDEVFEEVIPVQILSDQAEPPAPSEPAPAPRQLAPRQVASAAALVAQQALDLAAPEAPVAVAELPAEAVEVAAIENAPAPTEVARRQVQSRRFQALAAAAETPSAANLDLEPAVAPTLDESELAAPTVETSAPRALDSRARDIAAPRVFDELARAPVRDIRGSTDAAPRAFSGVETGAGVGEVGIDPGVAAELSSPGGSDAGGSGTALGRAPCQQAAQVQRYVDEMAERIEARWSPPDGTRVREKVTVVVQLDITATPRNPRAVEAANKELAASALAAVRRAAPFAPLDPITRCLTELEITLGLVYGVE